MSNNNRGSSSDSDSDGDPVVQVRVALQLAPDCWNPSLALDQSLGPIAVPADVGRKGLSAVVNHLLDRKLPKGDDDDDEDDDDDDDVAAEKGEDNRLPAIPFDFIVGKPSSTTRR